LADLFCSGVPLSTLDYKHDFTYHASSTTAQVYQDAVAKFDSAIALSADSALVVNFARVGKGRALLDLGAYAQAAQAVAPVPETFQYVDSVPWVVHSGGNPYLIIKNFSADDRDGVNGLPFLSSGDPRSTSATFATYGSYGTETFAARIINALGGNGYAPMTIADGTEAQLIQAEAALHANDTITWLGILNHLRVTAIVPGVGQAVPQLLPPVSMPSTDSARVSLMFAERAEWLYLTGHRQGDLRRLIRQYGRRQDHVYPTGTYRGAAVYGSDVTAPIPVDEYTNPLFHGCIDRNA
jgi:hypothetical protein